MLTPFREILEERRAAGAAVGAFTCYDVTTAIGVVRAAEARGGPGAAARHRGLVPLLLGRLLLPALLAVADEARVPAHVQLDHVDDVELIDAALAAGAGAVMRTDRLPTSDNAAFVAGARAFPGGRRRGRARPHRGGRGRRGGEAGALTNPDEAAASPPRRDVTAWRSPSGTSTGSTRAPRSSTGTDCVRSTTASASRSLSTAPPGSRTSTSAVRSRSASARST